MSHQKQKLTLGDLIRTVSQFTNNAQEMNLAVADLMMRGVVRSAKRHRRFKVVTGNSPER